MLRSLRTLRTISLTLILLTAAGCTFFTPEKRAEPVALPADYPEFSKGERPTTDWWEAFDNEELNSLVEQALQKNFDLREAWARLNQAQAIARRAGAELYPNLNYDGGYSHQFKNSKPENDSTSVYSEQSSYSLGLLASYELDVWGRIRSQTTAADFAVQASREDVETVAMTVAASVAETWVNLLAVREELRILEKQIEINAMLVQLVELRFANSMTTALAVSQQREILAATKAEVPLLKAREWVLLNTLAALVSKVPGEVSVKKEELPSPVPLPKAGLPTELLVERPDIRAAQARLHSADWEISAARANLLPTFTLSAKAIFENAVPDVLFSNWISTLAAGITGPIFDGGLREAEVDRTRAVAEERVAQYGRVVLRAIGEVENNMSNELRQREYIQGLEVQRDTAEEALLEARIRYLNGQSDYLPFLIELGSVQQLQRKLVLQHANLLLYRIALYRSLGGNWTNRLTPEGLSPESDKSDESEVGDIAMNNHVHATR